MKRVVTLAALLVLAFSMTPAQADSETQTYVASQAFSARVKRDNPPINVALSGNFRNTGDPTHIRVIDAAGPGVSFTVCQEGPADESSAGCGNGDDVSQNFCSTGANQLLSTAFRESSTNPILVFTRIADPLSSCDNLGTTGTVRLTW